jgi:phosphoserine aminotransferase
MTRVFNFSAGPAMLPTEVMEQAQAEFLDWHGTGMSIMEVSHRGKEFSVVAEEAEQDLRDLMGIPDNYRVLFLHGGASMQFSAIPLNLTQPGDTVDYFNTGVWSKKALTEAGRYANVNVVAEHTTEIPDPATWNLSDSARYVHYTPNETIGGLQFHFIPDVGDKPLIADMSSCILSEPLDVSRFGMIYAGAQKNIGPSGLGIVIVREDLIGHARPETPVLLDWKTQADNDSMYNTPPTYSWYMAGLVFKWLKRKGGLEAIGEVNRRKAKKLYDFIDSSDFYHNPVRPQDRSIMNVPFTLAKPELDQTFLKESDAAGLKYLKGHRLVGGMRASIYNAMPEEGVDALIAFMKDFERKYG